MLLAGQPPTVDLSCEYNEAEYFNDNEIRNLFTLYRQFALDFNSSASYSDEVVLFLKSKRGLPTLISIRWDTSSLAVYRGKVPANVGTLDWQATHFPAFSETYKTFIGLIKQINPSFFKQNSKVEIKYYETEFVLLRRTEGKLEWALTAFNRREFKNAPQYPGLAYKSLVDFILIEFSGMP